ncbi:MAG: sulfate adenylyltransferase subunit CysN [Bryobacterales bacterium]|nr:sulfate adenylyltransferase subunit CysN [Bryobacterales bacterium]
MAALADRPAEFRIEDFLAQEQAKDLLRFTTAGSVDDGKSTLIGRLLYDSQSVYEDQLKAVTKASVNRSAGKIDFSLLTDGLRAEREQGITIDVAYRYFATARRKFIIADTPGHEQYTRNMATGASTADLAVILIDARNGVLQQSRRHGYIASLLGIPNFAIAVNKMDAVGYDEAVFRSIESEYREFMARLGLRQGAHQAAPNVYFLPISALEGDNVVRRSRKMPWFEGSSLLEFLETVPVHQRTRLTAFRFPVQRVIRPDQNFRGYAGQVVSGTIRPGDGILALPSGRRSRVKSIETFDGPLDEAVAPMSVTLTLEDELDISRGDMIASAQKPPEAARQFDAGMVWLSEQPLDTNRAYLLKQTTQTLPAEVKAIKHRVNIRTLEHEPADRLEMNGIGVLRIETSRPIYFDPYTQNRATGSIILIDPETNATVGAGMIVMPVIVERERLKPAALDLRHERVTPVERIARYRHGGEIVSLGDRKALAWLLERRLFDRGCAVTVIEHASPETPVARETLTTLEQAGLLVLLVSSKSPDWNLPAGDSQAADFVVATLEQTEILLRNESLTGGEGI